MELRPFLLVLSLHSCGSLRKRGLSANSLGEFAAPANCYLGDGYGVDVGCSFASAMLPFTECEDDGPVACWEEVPSLKPHTSYYRTTNSRSSMTAFSDTLFDAEGGAYGAAANIGIGASFLKQSSLSLRSVGLFTGASKPHTVRRVRNNEFQNISSNTLLYIDRAPSRFVQRYGLRFVDTIQYGGSFLGGFVITSRNDSVLDIFAEIGGNSSNFDADLNVLFNNARSEHSESIEVRGHVSWRGGDPGSVNTLDPAGIQRTFESWTASPNSVPMTLTTRALSSNDALSMAVAMCSLGHGAVPGNAPDCEELHKQLTQTARLAQSTVRKLSSEYVETHFVDAAVRTAKGYTDILPDQKADLLALEFDIQIHKLEMEVMTDARAGQLQAELIDGNQTFFKAFAFADKFEEIFPR